MSIITVSSVSKSFGAMDLFAGVSFSVAKGARLALVGPNGIGKTTLLRILVGDQEADFQLEGVLWDVCLEPFAGLIRMQAEVEKLEVEMADPSRREQAMERY